MEEPSRNQTSLNQPSLNPTTSHPPFLSQDKFIDTEPSPKPEDFSSSSVSTIQPAIRPPATPVSWSSQLQKKKKSHSDHDNDRVTKYAKYFEDNEILPIPELVEAVEPKTLSLVVTNLRTRRLAGLKKESFEEVLKTAGIPGKYFYRMSFATWDVLLPSEDRAKKLATNNITAKYFLLQPEYRGQRRIKVTVCNVSMQLNGDVPAAYLSSHGGVGDYNLITSAHGTAYGDYAFTMILDSVQLSTSYHIIPRQLSSRARNCFVGTANSWATFHDPALKKPPSQRTKKPPPLLLPIQQLLLQLLRLLLQQQQRQKSTQTRKQGTNPTKKRGGP